MKFKKKNWISLMCTFALLFSCMVSTIVGANDMPEVREVGGELSDGIQPKADGSLTLVVQGNNETVANYSLTIPEAALGNSIADNLYSEEGDELTLGNILQSAYLGENVELGGYNYTSDNTLSTLSWYSDENCITQFDLNTVASEVLGLSIYTKLTPKTFDILVDSNVDNVISVTKDGSDFTQATFTYNNTYVSALGDVTVSVADTYRHSGWQLVKSGEDSINITDDTYVKITDATDYTLKPVVELNNVIKSNLTVKFMNGETELASKSIDSVTSNETAWSAVIGEQTATAENGYEFKGWATSEDGEVLDVTAKLSSEYVSNLADTITLYAVFEPINYTISFKYYNGISASTTTTVATVTYTIEDEVTFSDIATPSTSGDDIFDCWYADEACLGEKVTKVEKGSTGNKTFYGIIIKSSVTYLKSLFETAEKAINTGDSTATYNATLAAVKQYDKLVENGSINPAGTDGLEGTMNEKVESYRTNLTGFNRTDTSTGVILEADDLAWNIGLSVNEVDADTKVEITDLYDNILWLRDISLVDFANDKAYDLQDGEKVTLKIPVDILGDIKYDIENIIHQLSNGTIEIVKYEIVDGYYVIELDSLSPIGITGTLSSTGGSGEGTTLGTESSGNDISGGSQVATGDSSPVVAISILVIAGLAIAVFAIKTQKKTQR